MQASEVEVPPAVVETEQNGAFGRIGPENLVENGLQQQDAEGVKHAHHGQQQDARKPLEPERQAVAHKRRKFFMPV